MAKRKNSPIGQHYHVCCKCDLPFTAPTTEYPYYQELDYTYGFNSEPESDDEVPTYCGCAGSIGSERDKACESCVKVLEREADYDARQYRDDYDDCDFADPYGNSALRAEVGGHSGKCPSCKGKVAKTHHYCPHCGGKLNPRMHPCPTCRTPDVLTDKDVQLHYQCDRCADRVEGRGGYGEY